MKKIAIFVEGLGEQIFMRKVLFLLIHQYPISIDCIKIHGDNFIPAPYPFKNPDAKLFFLIVNVEGDSSVLTAIKEKERDFLAKNYVKIFGLRDMYSEEYRKLSSRSIDPLVNKKLVDKTNKIISLFTNPESISFHFSIMEIESWWISMYTLLVSLNPILTLELMEKHLGCLLSEIDPETSFYHPSSQLKKILKICKINYKKSKSDVESLLNGISIDDILTGFSNNRCNSLKTFYEELIATIDKECV